VKLASKTQAKQLSFHFNTEQLAPAQIRLLQGIMDSLDEVAKSEDEGDYFQACAELMRQCAGLIQQSRFVQLKAESSIPYGTQALEYSLDILEECREKSKTLNYDN
jgi:hypothetical protein